MGTVPCRWSTLGWQGARNRRQAIALEAFHFRGGYSQWPPGVVSAAIARFSHRTRTAGQRSAQFARCLASRIEKWFHRFSKIRKFGPLFNCLMVIGVAFGLVFALSPWFSGWFGSMGYGLGTGFRGGYRSSRPGAGRRPARPFSEWPTIRTKPISDSIYYGEYTFLEVQMATLLFVHGTNARTQSYSETLSLIKKKASELLKGYKVQGCEWYPLGACLHKSGDSIPEYNQSGDPLPAEEELKLARWRLLSQDPLLELSVLPRIRWWASRATKSGRCFLPSVLTYNRTYSDGCFRSSIPHREPRAGFGLGASEDPGIDRGVAQQRVKMLGPRSETLNDL